VALAVPVEKAGTALQMTAAEAAQAAIQVPVRVASEETAGLALPTIMAAQGDLVAMETPMAQTARTARLRKA